MSITPMIKAVPFTLLAMGAAAGGGLLENHEVGLTTVASVGAVVLPAAIWLSRKFTHWEDRLDDVETLIRDPIKRAVAQWAGGGKWPNTLEWHTIIGSTLGVGFSTLVAFCSSSVSNWRQARNGNGVDKSLAAKEAPNV